VVSASLGIRAADNPFLGDWALTIPGGAGWLGVDETNGKLQSEMLWGGGSVFPIDSTMVQEGKLVLTRRIVSGRRGGAGGRVTNTETMTGTLQGDTIQFVKQGGDNASFTGQRQPPLPPAPDLSKVRFGPEIRLFNGTDLSGWRLVEANKSNGWSVKDGLLINDVTQPTSGPHKQFGNLRTDREFEDFNLKVEVRVDKEQNSGVYVRGIYEVQVFDSYGRPPDSHNMGAVYSRIKPTESAEKPPGEWQTLDITFVDRHFTVVLNGKKIIDNKPARGCTGGALWSDVIRAGPIYLQGDHTGITYRSLVLRPVVK
jgi:hypothetical protein